MKPRGEYLSRLVGQVIQIWLPPMPPEGNEKAYVWIEDGCKGYVVNEVHLHNVDEVIALLTQYKLQKRKGKHVRRN